MTGSPPRGLNADTSNIIFDEIRGGVVAMGPSDCMGPGVDATAAPSVAAPSNIS